MIDWTVATSITEILAALAIVVLTFGLVRYARRQADAAQAAIAELVRDRELAYRPWVAATVALAVTGDRSKPNEYATTYALALTNVGTGPALEVQVCVDEYIDEARGRRWWSGAAGDLAIQGGWSDEVRPGIDERSRHLTCLTSGLGADAPDRPVIVAVRFRDVLGNWYRAPAAPGTRQPARWHEDEGTRPPWTMCHTI